ncbi:MAG: hypothetical protein ACXITV_03595 [Luteibaculaceae bacterium]
MKSARTALLLFIFLTCYQSIYAQGKAYRKHMPIYDLRGGQRTSDWIVEGGVTLLGALPGVTYNFEESRENINFEADRNPVSRPGVYLGFGRHWMLDQDKWFLESLEAVVSLSRFRGREALENGKITDTQTGLEMGDFFQNTIFSTTWLGVAFRVNYYNQISDKRFIRHALGLNFQGLLGSNLELKDGNLDLGSFYNSDESIAFHLHYRIGLGIKANSFTYVIPFAQVNFLSGYPWNDLRGAQGAINSNFVPITIGVQFKWLRKKQFKGCPTVESFPGVG